MQHNIETKLEIIDAVLLILTSLTQAYIKAFNESRLNIVFKTTYHGTIFWKCQKFVINCIKARRCFVTFSYWVHITPGKRETLMALHHISAAQSSPWDSIYRWNIVRIIEIKKILVYILIQVSYFNSNTSETSTKVKQKSNIII